jgi:hypothetical protein
MLVSSVGKHYMLGSESNGLKLECSELRGEGVQAVKQGSARTAPTEEI